MQKNKKQFNNEQTFYNHSSNSDLAYDYNFKSEYDEFSKVEEKRSYRISDIAKFIIPSLIGVIIFMLPIKEFDPEINQSKVTIPIAYVASFIQNNIGAFLPAIIVAVISISAIGALLVKLNLFKPKSEYLKGIFTLSPTWFVTRILAMIFVLMCYFKIGPSFIISEDTGNFILNNLLTTLIVIFVFAGLLLPLLLDFGLLEFVGTLLAKIMRPIFTLPGRSAVDCFTSWLGDGTLGVMLTAKQYEEGFYSEREAAIISTTFSAVSITFCLVVLKQVDMAHLFVPYYLTICLIGVICAVIIPRIPPLSLKKDSYYGDAETLDESIPSGETYFSWGIYQAINKAKNHEGLGQFFRNGIKNAVDMWLGVLPVVMAFGTIALVISNYTPIFQIIGKPFIPLLELLKLPEPIAASKTMLVGFTDMFIPTIIAGNEIKSELTRFVIATVSVTQLIYMSEVGALIIGSRIPVKVWEIFVIFIERTIISLVFVTLIGRFILHLA